MKSICAIPWLKTEKKAAPWLSSTYKQVEGRGILTEKTVESTYKAMKEVIENGYEIKNQFDYNKYNEEISKKIEDIINERE